MLFKVKEWIKEHEMITTGDQVLVACSGGPDSLALLHLLHSIRQELEINLCAAHVDHMFRGRESEEDAEFVKDFCAGIGVNLYCSQINVPAFIKNTGRSPQDAARFLRYDFLRQTAQILGGAKIATGHHSNDQAETVLINLLRGAGSEGLRGIRPVREGMIRPFLNVSRQEIEQYCRGNNLVPRLDKTNYKTKYRRNRVRLELLPELAEKYNPNIRESLCRTAVIIGDEHDFISKSAEEKFSAVAKIEPGRLIIERSEFVKLHIVVQREIIRLALKNKMGSLTGVTHYHVECLINLIKNGNVGNGLDLPNEITAKCGYCELALFSRLQVKKEVNAADEITILQIPGRTTIRGYGTIVAQLSAEYPAVLKSDLVLFDWDKLVPPVIIRGRAPGDRFYPKGMAGSKKIKEFFIDEKIPQKMRGKIPIVCDCQGIIWVAGYRQSAIANATRETKKFLQLTIMKQEDNGYA